MEDEDFTPVARVVITRPLVMYTHPSSYTAIWGTPGISFQDPYVWVDPFEPEREDKR